MNPRSRLTTILCLAMCWVSAAHAGTRVSVSSGNWSSPATWHPAGVPGSNETITVRPGHSVLLDVASAVQELTVSDGGEVLLGSGKTLSISSVLRVNGRLDMQGGDISVPAGSHFILGPGAEFIWDPATNTSAGTALFINGIEQFDPASTLVIRKWYDYAQAPLGSVVSGSFGNVVLNSMQGNLLMEWNQDNQFESHPVLGTLTVDHGWVVLDKSGSISHTTFGEIALLNANSFIDFHHGHHPSGFTVETGKITNLGGHLNGIYNGNGDLTLHVTGDLVNYGQVVLNYNSGVAHTGEGDVQLDVDGSYFQSKGDFRGLFNLASYQAGTVKLRFGAFTLSGGIFIGHYACHSGTGVNEFTVTGNFNISCQSTNDKFRVSGLTSLAGNFCTARTKVEIGGQVLLSGHDGVEVTTSGSIGSETVVIEGDVKLAGCSFNGNMGSHTTGIDLKGNLVVSGGKHCLSRSPGNVHVKIWGDLEMQGGHFSLKGNTGAAILVVNNDYGQSGGICNLHDNQTYTQADSVTWIVHGSFLQQGGTINFDNHPNTQNINQVVMKGKSCRLSGNGIIMQASGFGLIEYATSGMLAYQRPGNKHLVNRIRQVIAPGCTLDIQEGNLQVSSSPHHSHTDLLIVSAYGVLKMGTSKVVSNLVNNYTGLVVHDHGRLTTQNPNGLYNGTDQACINATGNMAYFLGRKSVIEYNGVDNQVLTGNYPGANSDHNKYGILEINFNGTADLEKVTVGGPSVHIRTQLRLIRGELCLDNNPIAIESGAPSAIMRTSGYIRADYNDGSNKGFIHWMNMETGDHEFPFGFDSDHYLPFIFTPLSGMGNTVSVATRSTGPDNVPMPYSFGYVTGIKRDGRDISVSSVVDRWWDVNAPGFVADVVLSYRGAENTTADSLSGAPFGVQTWNGYGWTPSVGSARLVREGVGNIALQHVSRFGQWIISTRTEKATANEFLDFAAALVKDAVSLHWTVATGNQALRFIIERSTNNRTFSPIRTVDPKVSASEFIAYANEDPAPLTGQSFYRVRQENLDGSMFLSNSERIDYRPEFDQNLQFLTLAPNPFKHEFTLTYYALSAGDATIMLSDQSGRLMDKWPVSMIEGLNTYKYHEKENLQPGIYVLTLTTGRSTISRKIIKS